LKLDSSYVQDLYATTACGGMLMTNGDGKNLNNMKKIIKKPRPIIAYAAVDRKKPVLHTNDIFRDKDITMAKNEMLIKVKITPL
jgi:uncharacterized protein YvpB